MITDLKAALADWLRTQASTVLAADPKLSAEALQFADTLAAKDETVVDATEYEGGTRHSYGQHSGGLTRFDGR